MRLQAIQFLVVHDVMREGSGGEQVVIREQVAIREDNTG